jgi:hypothetical protein
MEIIRLLLYDNAAAQGLISAKMIVGRFPAGSQMDMNAT